jgi:hypothetical protein
MVSIYEDEIRHKPWAKTVEDQLTSRVFGALEILPKDKVLLKFLEKLATDTTYGEDKNDPALLAIIRELEYQGVRWPKVELWKSVRGTFPDVCINTSRVLIVIEVKKNSKANKDTQLIPQFKAAHKEAGDKKLAYFLLTKDYEKPVEAQLAEDELKRRHKFPNATIHWRRWPQVWKCLGKAKEELDKAGVKDTSLCLLDATIKLLEAENMNGPTGFKKEWFGNDVIKALDNVQELCQEIRATVGEVIAKVAESSIEYFDNNFPTGRSDTRKERLRSPDEWILHNFDFYFKDKDWKRVDNGEEDPCLYVTFWLKSDNTGADIGFWWSKPRNQDKEAIIEQTKEKAKKNGYTFDEDFWDNEGGLSVFRRLSPEDLENDKNVVDTLKNGLVEMRDFAEDIEAMQKYLGYKNKTQTRRKK